MTTPSRALTRPLDQQQIAILSEYSQAEIDLVRDTVAKGCSDLEMAFFLYTARSRGLNPFARQIYAIVRNQGGKPVMVIQTGIDGYRSIAARSGSYAGTDRPVFGPMVHSDGVDHPEWAEVTTYKIVQGVRVPFVGYAEWQEFKQSFNGRLGEMWQKMPRNQLAKCAEAQALRKGFPEVLAEIEFAEPEPVPETETVATVAPTASQIAAPTAPGPLPGQPDVDVDPLLVTCPIHETPWFQSSKMPEPAHRDGDKWCNLTRALNTVLLDEARNLEWDDARLLQWTKEQWGKPRSGLRANELATAIRALQAQAEVLQGPPPADEDAPPPDVGDVNNDGDGQLAF